MIEQYMEAAFEEAQRALSIGEVPVGCVFVYESEIIVRACNDVNATKNATRHAEFVCIDKMNDYCSKNALSRTNVLSLISVVVTVEPCIMCSAALHSLGVREIFYGCSNDRFGGKTVVDVSQVLNRRIPILGGVKGEAAMQLLKDFYKGKNPSAPVPKLRR